MHVLGGFTGRCWRCDARYLVAYAVCDDPHIEETRCAECGTVIYINGKAVPAMDEQVMAHDGEGRR